MPNLPISGLPELTAVTPTSEYAVEFSGTTYKIKQSTLSPFPTVYGLFVQTGDSITVSATTVESTLIGGGIGTTTIPSNSFNVGDSFKCEIGGIFSTRNNDTVTIRVKSGSTILSDSGPQTMVSTTNDVWFLTMNFTIRNIGVPSVASILTLGVFHYTKTSNGNVEGFSFNTLNNTTFDTTVSNVLNITVEFSSSDVLNSIYSDTFVLNKIY